MSDNKKHEEPHERPLDPTRDAEDVIGDPTGLTGITTGHPKDISAEPDDIPPDLSNEPGGLLDVTEPPKESLGVPRDSYSEKIYNKKINQGMSDTYANAANDIASDTSEEAPPTPEQSEAGVTEQGAQTVTSDENAIKNNADFEAGTNADPLTANQGELVVQESPAEAGEQSVSGDMPTPDSDDDTLANAQAVGMQTDEDEEHPEEIDIARDIDEAEEYDKTH